MSNDSIQTADSPAPSVSTLRAALTQKRLHEGAVVIDAITLGEMLRLAHANAESPAAFASFLVESGISEAEAKTCLKFLKRKPELVEMLHRQDQLHLSLNLPRPDAITAQKSASIIEQLAGETWGGISFSAIAKLLAASAQAEKELIAQNRADARFFKQVAEKALSKIALSEDDLAQWDLIRARAANI